MLVRSKSNSCRLSQIKTNIYNTTIIEAPFFREWMWSSGLGIDVRHV